MIQEELSSQIQQLLFLGNPYCLSASDVNICQH